MKKTHFLLVLLLVFSSCWNNSTKGQVIPGSKGITIERCNEIFNGIPDHRLLSSIPDVFSKEFGGMLKEYYQQEYGQSYLAELLGGIGDDEFMLYWYNGNGDGFSDNAQKTYSLVKGSETEADILLNMDEVIYDNGRKLYDMHEAFHMILVKEKGVWMLDDWCQTYSGDEWYSRKTELKEYLDEERNTVYLSYEGYVEDDDGHRPFKAFLGIKQNDDGLGDRTVYGGIRFDDKDDDFYDYLNGSMNKDGVISFKVDDGGDGQVFFGKAALDLKKISGSCQVLKNNGNLAVNRLFMMEVKK